MLISSLTVAERDELERVREGRHPVSANPLATRLGASSRACASRGAALT
jgi:hypothetical protein